MIVYRPAFSRAAGRARGVGLCPGVMCDGEDAANTHTAENLLCPVLWPAAAKGRPTHATEEAPPQMSAFRDELRALGLIGFYDFWQSLCGKRRMPRSPAATSRINLLILA